MSDKSELAALKKKVEALESALSGKEDKPEPKKEFVPKTDAEWIDEMHQMRERQANSWMPPNAVQEMAQHPCNQVMRGVIQDRHAPTGPSSQGAIPSSQQVSNVHVDGPANTSGWREPTSLGPQPGIGWVDAIAIADDARQRAELKRKLGG